MSKVVSSCAPPLKRSVHTDFRGKVNAFFLNLQTFLYKINLTYGNWVILFKTKASIGTMRLFLYF